SYCDSLPAQDREICVSQWQAVSQMKSLPKGASALPAMAPVLYESCMQQALGPKETCDQIREALTTNSKAKCKGLSEHLSAFCEAVLGDDISLCKDDGCKEIVKGLAKWRTEGLSALQD